MIAARPVSPLAMNGARGVVQYGMMRVVVALILDHTQYAVWHESVSHEENTVYRRQYVGKLHRRA